MEQAKRSILLGSTTISLVALLVYTFFHTGATLAHYVEPWIIGYIAAAGIETAVISLSIRIGDLRRARQDSRLLVSVLLAVLGVSTLANVSEGFAVMYGQPLTVTNVQQLDWLQALIGLASTGLISVVVFAMSEVVSVDVNQVVRDHERERRANERRAQPRVQVEPRAAPELSDIESPVLRNGVAALPVEQARIARDEQASLDQERREQEIVHAIQAGEGSPTWSALARELGISRTTLYADRQRLLDRGRIAEVDGRWTVLVTGQQVPSLNGAVGAD